MTPSSVSGRWRGALAMAGVVLGLAAADGARAQALAALKATIQDQLAAEFPENVKDVANTKNIHAVVLNGEFLDRARLDQMLREARIPNDSSKPASH